MPKTIDHPSGLTAADHQAVRIAVLKALGEPTRLSILEALLKADELTVSEICDAVAVDMSAISHHLACLRDCGLVTVRREGKYLHYSVSRTSRVRSMLRLLHEHAADVEQGVLSCKLVSPDKS